MKKATLLLPLLLLLMAFAGHKQTGKSNELNIDYMMRGYFMAASSQPDTLAPGGYAPSGNLPKKMVGQFGQHAGKVHMLIDTTARRTFAGKYNGYAVYISNETDSIAAFHASDSRISVVAEVLQDGIWKPVEYLPQSWCGNSYHRVFLNRNEFWEFTAPAYKGKIKTKMRYCLTGCGTTPIYSNEIAVSVNPGQFAVKQGHNPNGLMDPYTD